MDRTPNPHPIAPAPAIAAVHRHIRLAAAARTALLGLAERRWPTAEFERVDRESRPRWIEFARALKLTLD
jgi:hypothetical protein